VTADESDGEVPGGDARLSTKQALGCERIDKVQAVWRPDAGHIVPAGACGQRSIGAKR